jgi:hypothetical protein
VCKNDFGGLLALRTSYLFGLAILCSKLLGSPNKQGQVQEDKIDKFGWQKMPGHMI